MPAADPLPAKASDEVQGFDPASDAPGGPPRPLAVPAGDSASREALARLKAAVSHLRGAGVRPLLDQCMAALRRDDWQAAGQMAIKALQVDEHNGVGWWLLAIAREKAGDFRSALACFESALKLTPQHGAIANDLGRLAFRLGMPEMAEKFFRHYLLHEPGHPEGCNNLACALRDQKRFDDAIEVLRPAIYEHPKSALLWNTLGSVMNEQGQVEQAITFYDEALKLQPGLATARYNRGNARLTAGDAEGALADVEAALKHGRGAELPMMRLARALALMACGRLTEAWEAYQVRIASDFPKATRFLVDRPAWTPEAEVGGRSLLVVGEQGLGDEIMFGSMLPDAAAAVGEAGRLTLAVEPRLVSLFQRSFPNAVVGAHATYKIDGHTVRVLPFLTSPETIDLWTPLAGLTRRWRKSLDDFPATTGWLKPDPERVAHWRGELDALGQGRKVGVLWKSLNMDASRARYFSPFEQWRPVLESPGALFVNLQYGDCAEELQAAEDAGLSIWNPPGIDLKQDLDDVAALSAALDLVAGPSNTNTNIAAAVGTETWVITQPGAWPQLGTPRLPWHPAARVFQAASLSDWAPVMAEVAAALRA